MDSHIACRQKCGGSYVGLIQSSWLHSFGLLLSLCSPHHVLALSFVCQVRWVLQCQTLHPLSTMSRGREKDASWVCSLKNQNASFSPDSQKSFLWITWFKLRHAHFWPFFPGQFPCRKWFRLLISKLHVWQTRGMTLKDLDQYSRLYQILHLLFQYWIFSCVLLPLLSRNTIHRKLKLTTYLIDVMSNFVKGMS